MTEVKPAAPKMVDVFSDSDEDRKATAISNPVGTEIAALAERDERVVALSADMSGVLADLRAAHPERYFEFGIAETNVASVAAGLASTGLRPYVLSMAPFGMLKCAEQLRTDVAYNNLPVRFIARLSGLAMGLFGTSHHAVEDLPIARSLTNLTVVTPADGNATVGLLRSTFDHPGPVYFRISEGTEPVYASPPDIERGQWPRVREGSDITLIGTGMGVGLGIAAARLLEADGVSVGVLDAAYIKPADEAAVLAAAASGPIVTVEDHNEIGGLGTLVAEVLGRHRSPAALDVVALPDKDIEVGIPAELYEYYGLTADNVAARARRLLAG